MKKEERSAKEIREKFIEFFIKKGHKLWPPSSLVSEDPSVLFCPAGMQQFKKWFSGLEKPKEKRVITIQPCIRTSDIEEVGDEKHLTFFEMLGNFAFGEDAYFKKEAILWAKEFLENELKIESNKILLTVFGGDKKIAKDKESIAVLKDLGYKKIKLCGKKDNFWGPTGQEGPCGPTVEFYVNDLEVWNLVFNEYYQDKSGKLSLLKQKGVDTGLGLERMLAVLNQQKDVFQTELFLPLILKIEELSNKKYQEFKKEFRIIADHLKSAVFIANEGIEPSNLERGYVLRRLIRKAVRLARKLEINNLAPIASSVFEIYSLKNKEKILEEIKKEEERFSKALQLGLKEFEKLKDQLNGEIAFKLYETYGFPLEMTQELAKEAGIKIDRKEFFKAFKKHQQVSRAGVKRFKSGLAGYSEKEKKLHTATHLLLASLRKILSEKIVQKGSNITPQRLRFDFNWPERLTEEQIKKVEDLVSLKIKENLPVTMQEMSLKQAKKTKALGVFDKRYGARVKVYTIGNIKNPFSKEICAGPHIKRTGEIGKFKIIKEESVGAGIRRIKAILE